MKIASVISTKGGPGKTTVTANLGAFCAEANLRTLLVDLDTQPSLSSFYRLEQEAPGGTYELISQNQTRADQVISRTCIPNLSLILSNDPHNQLSNMLLSIVDLATYAREGYNAQLSIAYISLINTVNNIAERDQMLGRPIINVTDEGHIITKTPLLSPYVVKITKMWRKLGAWFWLATQNIDDLPKAAEPMLNMIEWCICLNMPPDEVAKISRFRELNEALKKLMLSARKESGKFTEGVILSKSTEVLFRAVPPSLYLAMAMTEPEEKAERFRIMGEMGVCELDAAIEMGRRVDRLRGI